MYLPVHLHLHLHLGWSGMNRFELIRSRLSVAGLGLGLTTRVETWRCCFGLFGTIYGYYCTAAEQGIWMDGWKNTLRRMFPIYVHRTILIL